MVELAFSGLTATLTDHGPKLVVLLPGVSGGACSARYDHIADAAADAGWSTLRMDFGFQQLSDESRTIEDCVAEVRQALASARKRIGTGEKAVIAKSFGAMVALLAGGWDRIILLGPYVRLRDAPAATDRPLSSIRLSDVFLGPMAPTAVLHVHGDADDVIAAAEAKVPGERLVLLRGASHKLDRPQDIAAITAAIQEFLA